MLPLPSSRLLRSHHFAKTHLYKTANHTQKPTKFRSTSLTVVSHSSYAHPLDRSESWSISAGMPVVGLGTRNPEEALISAGASFVVKDFDDPKLWEALEENVRKAE